MTTSHLKTTISLFCKAAIYFLVQAVVHQQQYIFILIKAIVLAKALQNMDD